MSNKGQDSPSQMEGAYSTTTCIITYSHSIKPTYSAKDRSWIRKRSPVPEGALQTNAKDSYVPHSRIAIGRGAYLPTNHQTEALCLLQGRTCFQLMSIVLTVALWCHRELQEGLPAMPCPLLVSLWTYPLTQ